MKQITKRIVWLVTFLAVGSIQVVWKALCQGTIPGTDSARPYRPGLCPRADL